MALRKRRNMVRTKTDRSIVFDPDWFDAGNGLMVKIDTSSGDMMEATVRHTATKKAFKIYMIPDDLLGAITGFDFGNLKEADRKELKKYIPGFMRRSLSLLGIEDAKSFTPAVTKSHEKIVQFMSNK